MQNIIEPSPVKVPESEVRKIGKPFVVGIAGGSGAGKSTIVRQLRESSVGEHLCVLHHDSYYHDLSRQHVNENREANWDHPESLENSLLVNHIQQLVDGQSVKSPIYDFATHRRRVETTPIDPQPIIVVEGVLIFAVPELRNQFDLRLFVDIAGSERLARRLERDINERGRSEDSVREQFSLTVQPMHEQFVEPSKVHSHLIVPGVSNGKSIEVLVDYLTTKI